MSEHPRHAKTLEELPQARIERNWGTYLIWLVPIGAAALAAWFIYSEMLKSGPTLHIFFENAAGLQPGKSQVRYRGAQIGDVKAVKLTKDHRQVEVIVTMDESAESFAREGSQFWIVKPELGAEEIRGLRTIVSGNYITVEPGDGNEETSFQGLSQAPVIPPKDSLEVELLAEKIGSIKERSPVFYRGIQVGQVTGTGLGKASQVIRIRVEIKRHYAPLVRMNSKFWNAGGIHASLSFSGINIGAQSSETLLSGGIDFATPDTSEKAAPPGTAFRLYDKADDSWLGWSPPIELDETNAAAETPRNSPK